MIDSGWLKPDVSIEELSAVLRLRERLTLYRGVYVDCGGIVMIGDFWRRIRKAKIDARLKTNMLDRGMSADEIRVVLEAGSKRIEG